MIKYDSDYFENMLHMYAGSAASVAKTRWAFILEHVDAKTVLDFGCGLNFLTIYAPDDTNVDSFDIGHIDNSPYPQTGIRHFNYDVVCFFDVLEHADWAHGGDEGMEEAITLATHVCVSIPMLPPGAFLEEWKHHKPGEHLTYFTKESLIEFFKCRGFKLIADGTPECPPRSDIWTAMFQLDNDQKEPFSR